MKCRNRWASSKPLPLVGTPSFPPKPEFMNDYAASLRALVERYDKDGQDDAPGLLFPVEYWEIEAEWGTFWPGTAEEYLALLSAFTRVRQLDLGRGVYGYQFAVDAKPVYVLWYDDGRRYLPGDSPPTTAVELRIAARSWQLTPTPTERGLAEPRPQVRSPRGGVLKLEIGTVPLFVEPVR